MQPAGAGWLTACAYPAGSRHDRPCVELRSKEHLITAIRSIRRRLAGNLALSLGVIAVLLAASEIVLRFYYTPENLGTVFRFDKTLGWALKPDSHLRAVDYQRRPGRATAAELQRPVRCHEPLRCES